MDARLNPYALLGLSEGDAHIIRNAGGAVTPDVIRSLTISQRLLGTEEVEEIFRAHGEAYRQRHTVTTDQRAAMRAIAACRTAALGGHVDVCDRCGHERPAYNSCRNRCSSGEPRTPSLMRSRFSSSYGSR
jgi:hypothetical protein